MQHLGSTFCSVRGGFLPLEPTLLHVLLLVCDLLYENICLCGGGGRPTAPLICSILFFNLFWRSVKRSRTSLCDTLNSRGIQGVCNVRPDHAPVIAALFVHIWLLAPHLPAQQDIVGRAPLH